MSLATLAFMSLASCNLEVPVGNGTTVPPTDMYVVQESFYIDNTDLTHRLSLIAPIRPSFRRMIGINEFDIFGMDTESLSVGAKVARSKFWRFVPGSFSSEGRTADILEYETMRPVGTLQYAQDNTYPNHPWRVIELCSGKHENSCVLSYNSETKKFNIQLNE